MTGVRVGLAVEWRKARRSAVPAVTAGVFAFAAGIEGLFMFIAARPERAKALGLVGQKAQLAGLAPDWTGLLAFAAQVMAVGGLMVFAFCGAWVFGREFADGTARYLLALPISRGRVVAAKLLLLLIWCAALATWFVGLTLAVGALLHLPGGGTHIVVTGVLRVLLAAGLQTVALTPVVLVASAGRGYLPPIATALGMVVVAQVAGALGWASAVPWAIPAVAAGLVPGVALGTASLVGVAVWGLAGIVGTVLWWRSGDVGA
ncbi:MAG TPA: ABC transporter permease [Actinotalea sp.]